ncbi:hypothetical protein MUP56_00605 [Patescibacteria group bacterium]|nr:hypothetical protein [Patescibacteria group bacterium]
MKRFLIILFIITFTSFLLTPSVFAAKVRVRKPRATKTGVSYSSASVSLNTHSITLSLMNLTNVKSVNYELSYSSWDIPQGAMGSIVVSGQTTDNRDLYFGTCSHGDCTPHYGLSSKASLLVCSTLKNGTEWCKRYNINTKRLQ